VEISEANAPTLANGGHGGTDEVIWTRQSPSMGGIREKVNDEQNDRGRCQVEDEEVSGNTNVESMEAFGSKNNGESSTRTDNPTAIKKIGSECLKECGSQGFDKKTERRNEVIQESPKPPRSGALQAQVGSSSKIWDGSRSSRIEHWLVNIGKAKEPCIEHTATILSSTDDNKDETLAVLQIRVHHLSGHTASPRCNLKLLVLLPQSLNAMNIVIHGGLGKCYQNHLLFLATPSNEINGQKRHRRQ